MLSRSALLLVLGATLLTACGSSHPAGEQVVQLFAGGGTSEADSGPATALRLPARITAMTATEDTVWLAGIDADKRVQLISIGGDGQARRFRLPARSPTPTSLTANVYTENPRALYAAADDSVIWRLDATTGRLVVHSGVVSKRPSVDGPFAKDGTAYSQARYGRIISVGTSDTGRLAFVEVQHHCSLLRAIDSLDLTTLAGEACLKDPTTATWYPHDPANGMSWAYGFQLSWPAPVDLGNSLQMQVITPSSVVQRGISIGFDTALGAGENVPDAQVIPSPKTSRPFGDAAPARRVRFTAATDQAKHYVVSTSSESATAVLVQSFRSTYPKAFTWRVQGGGRPDLLVTPNAPTSIAYYGYKIATASAVGDNFVFQDDNLLVAASRPDGAIIANVSIPKGF